MFYKLRKHKYYEGYKTLATLAISTLAISLLIQTALNRTPFFENYEITCISTFLATAALISWRPIYEKAKKICNLAKNYFNNFSFCKRNAPILPR